jgi:hypothetical protein
MITSVSEGQSKKPSKVITSTEEGITIRERDVHVINPQICLITLCDPKITSLKDVQQQNPYEVMTSTETGIEI